ncbi:MAG: DUF11 domain-containing protein, partial [Gammaproteobacteria bacterium]|nr:DUF11 domain-containing protein [Gammaproteobacteria bacterium]
EGNFTATLDDEDQFGSSVANIGDLDGDGIADMAAAARRDDDGGNDHGAVYVLFQNSSAGSTVEVYSDSDTKPSQVALPATTVISVDALDVYDAAYPGGSVITSELNGAKVYVRTTVSDPFGYYDVTSLDLTITDPGSGMTTVPAVAVDSSGCDKIFEYEWQTPTQEGNYDLQVTAKEGYEDTVTDQANTPFNLTQDDTGTPCALEFTDAAYDPVSDYTLPGTVYVELIDADKDDDTGVAESLTITITTTNGDSETVTLTETGVSTGIFHGSIAATASGVNTENGTLNGAVGNSLTVTYTDAEDPGDICTADATFPAASPSVTLTKTLISPADAIAVVGEAIQFRLVVSNTGNSALSGLTLTDNFSTSCLTFVDASITPDATASGSLTWNTSLGTIAVGENVTIDVNFTGAGAVGCDPATNAADVTDGGSLTDSDNATVTVTDPSVSITKTRTSAATANVGETVTFDIVVTNTGTTTLSTVPLTDDFSAFCMTFISASESGGNYPPDGSGSGSLLWSNIGPLTPAQSKTITLSFTALNDCDSAENEGIVSSVVDENGDDAPSVSDTDDVVITENPVIGLAKSLTGVVDNGGNSFTVTFLFTVENFGDVVLNDLEIFDDIATQFSAYSPTSYSATNGTLNANSSWDGTAASNILASGQSLAVGASANVSVSFDVTVAVSVQVNNTATAKGTSPVDTEVTDTSTDGLDPDGTDDDDNPDESTPTPVKVFDIDEDDDGIPDITESGGNDPEGDEDGDGTPNWQDTSDDGTGDGSATSYVDTDGNGVPDVYDADGDGIPNHLDLDSDNDGIADIVEAGGVDTNGDGTVDNLTDTDSDGLVDLYDTDNGGNDITNVDSDGDGIPDTQDLDADNDGIADVVEAGGTDTDGDGFADNYVDADGDGFNDVVDGDVGNDGTAENTANVQVLTGADTDADGIPNSYPSDDKDGDGQLDHLDLDADNDGIADVVEAGGTDADGDGFADNYTDTDGDGFNDVVDGDVGNDGTTENTANVQVLTGADTDNDGIPNSYPADDTDGDGLLDHLDLDADNDGIPDVVEAGGTDADGDGLADNYVDTDGDGFNDVVDGDVGNDGTAENTANAQVLTGPDAGGDGVPDSYPADDTDGDGLLDHLDLDADNDGIPDVVEAGGTDADGDGLADNYADTDGDGFNDVVDGDVGNDGTAENTANAQVLTGADSDNDGVPNSYPADDTDSDGLLDHLDLDADNDGIPDVVEAGGTDADGDGLADNYADTDGDGFNDVVDGDVGNDGTAENTANAQVLTGPDAGGDGVPDSYPADDTDGDGLLD